MPAASKTERPSPESVGGRGDRPSPPESMPASGSITKSSFPPPQHHRLPAYFGDPAARAAGLPLLTQASGGFARSAR